MESFQALLAKMRDEFLLELQERCDLLDELIIGLEKSPDNRGVFDELYRAVHSLKGSGGTHGLNIITTICHQLENLLTEADSKKTFGEIFTSRALSYVDLIRRVDSPVLQDKSGFAKLEADLEALRLSCLGRRQSVLIVESSKLMSGLYQEALAALPMQFSVESNGMTGLSRMLHESYDLVIVGRELKELNGVALIAALRMSHTRNQEIPAILISSKNDPIPEFIVFDANIARDKAMAKNLLSAVKHILFD